MEWSTEASLDGVESVDRRGIFSRVVEVLHPPPAQLEPWKRRAWKRTRAEQRRRATSSAWYTMRECSLNLCIYAAACSLVYTLGVVAVGRKNIIPLQQRVGTFVSTLVQLQRPNPEHRDTTRLKHVYDIAHLRARVDPLVAAVSPALAEEGTGRLGGCSKVEVEGQLTRPEPPCRPSTNPA